MNSDLQVWQIPRDVYSQVIVSLAELEYKVRPCGELGKYLFEQLEEHGHTSLPGQPQEPENTGVWGTRRQWACCCLPICLIMNGYRRPILRII